MYVAMEIFSLVKNNMLYIWNYLKLVNIFIIRYLIQQSQADGQIIYLKKRQLLIYPFINRKKVCTSFTDSWMLYIEATFSCIDSSAQK